MSSPSITVKFKIKPDAASYMHHADQVIQLTLPTLNHRTDLYKETTSFALSATNDEGVEIGGVAGYALFDYVVVEAIWVEPSARHQKIGQTLYNKVEAHARELMCKRILVSTFAFHQVLGFWQKQDFVIAGQSLSPDADMNIFYLEKRLRLKSEGR